jgi:hypothetical protein
VKNSLKSICRAVSDFAKRTGEIEAVRIDGKVCGFVDPRGAFHAVKEPCYAGALRILATSTDPRIINYSRRDRLASLRAVRKIDTDMGRKLP